MQGLGRFNRVIFEGDKATIIRAIKDSLIIDDILRSLSYFELVDCVHVKREANVVAHELARI